MSKISSAVSTVGSLFTGPDYPDPPPIEPPEEIPDTTLLDEAESRQAVRKRRTSKSGFESTLLTGLGGGGSNLGVG